MIASKEVEPQIYYHKELGEPTTWTSLEVDFPPDPCNRSPTWLKHWLWSCDALSREAVWVLLDLWPMELWDNKWVCFKWLYLICGGRNRKLIHWVRNLIFPLWSTFCWPTFNPFYKIYKLTAFLLCAMHTVSFYTLP